MSTCQERIENNQKEISIRSNSPLFGLSVNKAKQSLNFENNNYSILNEFNYKKGKSNLISKLLLLHKNSSSINSNIIDGNEYGLLRNQNTLQAQFLWQNLWGSKWRTSLGIKSTNNFIHLDHNKSDYSVIEPYFMINYAISQFHKIGLSSDFSHDFPSLFQLQNRLLIDDFQSIKSASVVGFNNPINKKGINFDYLNINIKNQSILFSKISYSIFDKSIVQNTIYDTRFIKSNYLFSPKTSQFQWFTLYDLRFNSLPFSIKNSFVYMNTNSFSYFDSVENQTKIQNISAKQQFLTNFKNSIFQIDLGYNFNNVFTSQSVSNFTNNNNSFQLFFTLKGKYKEKVKWDIGWVFNNQNSGLNQNKIHFLNCNGELNLTKKIKLVIAGFNLLNLNNNKFIATDNNPSFFTESINQIMPGYLMSGLNFSF